MTAGVLFLALIIVVAETAPHAKNAFPWLGYTLDPGSDTVADPGIVICTVMTVDVPRSGRVRTSGDRCERATYLLGDTSLELLLRNGEFVSSQPLLGKHGKADRAWRPFYLPSLGTIPRYYQIETAPNLAFTALPARNTLIATNMGQQLVEVDPLGHVVWERKPASTHRDRISRMIFGECRTSCVEPEIYSSIQKLDERRVLYTVTNQHLVVVHDRSTGRNDLELRVPSPRSARMTSLGLLVASGGDEGYVALYGPTGAETWRFGGLAAPREAILLRDGSVAIADTFADRVLVVNPGSSRVLREWSGPAIRYPGGLAEDADGSILASSEHSDQIQRLSDRGMTPLFEDGTLHGPAKIAIADNGDLIVADSGRHRVIQIRRDGTVVWELTNLNDPMGVWR